MTNFKDEETAAAWFHMQNEDVCTALAVRAALRALGGIGLGKISTTSKLLLPVLRAALTASVTSAQQNLNPDELKLAAKSALHAINSILIEDQRSGFRFDPSEESAARIAGDSAATSAAEAAALAMSSNISQTARNAAAAITRSLSAAAFSADYAALSLNSPYTADSAKTLMSSAFTNDAERITSQRIATPREILTSPVWEGTHEPAGLEKGIEKILGLFGATPDIWQFWNNWYLTMIRTGEPDWAMSRKVALIPDGIWDEGPGAVAREIERIEALLAAKRDEEKQNEIDPQDVVDALPLAEAIAFDENSEAYAVPIQMERQDLLSRTLARVSDAIKVVLSSSNNGLHEGSHEIRILSRAIDRYSNDPARIEMDFVSAHATLTQQMLRDYIPTSSENLALQSSLEEGARAIRATHPEVAENRALLTGQSLREMSVNERAKIADAVPVLEAIAREDLAEDFKVDTLVLIADRNAPSSAPLTGLIAFPEYRHAPLPEEVRFFSRIAKIRIKLKESPELLAAVVVSAPITAANLIVLLDDLVALGLKLLALIP